MGFTFSAKTPTEKNKIQKIKINRENKNKRYSFVIALQENKPI